jgi:hypothetical protein
LEQFQENLKLNFELGFEVVLGSYSDTRGGILKGLIGLKFSHALLLDASRSYVVVIACEGQCHEFNRDVRRYFDCDNAYVGVI